MSMKFSVLSSQFSVFTEAMHPVNVAGLVLNGSMLLCLVIVITLGRRKLRKHRSDSAIMLFSEPRQCLLGFKQIGNPHSKANLERVHHFHLPALSKEDRL